MDNHNSEITLKTYLKLARKQKIKKLLRGNPEGMPPREIAFFLEENPSTIKSFLRRMEKLEVVRRKFRGIYVLNDTNQNDEV